MSEAEHEPKSGSRKARGRWTTIALAAVAGVAIGGGAYAWRSSQQAEPAAEVASLEQAGIGGPFQLVDQDGRAVDESVLRGKWSAVFFGYTGCPDFCPATLQTLQAAAQQLGPDGEKLQVVLITVDPERDTPATLKSYLEGYEFPGGVRGLTGTPEQVEAAAKAWKVYHRKAPPSRPASAHGYLVDHTTAVYLTNPEGRFVEVFSHQTTPAEAARQIRRAMDA